VDEPRSSSGGGGGGGEAAARPLAAGAAGAAARPDAPLACDDAPVSASLQARIDSSADAQAILAAGPDQPFVSWSEQPVLAAAAVAAGVRRLVEMCATGDADMPAAAALALLMEEPAHRDAAARAGAVPALAAMLGREGVGERELVGALDALRWLARANSSPACAAAVRRQLEASGALLRALALLGSPAAAGCRIQIILFALTVADPRADEAIAADGPAVRALAAALADPDGGVAVGAAGLLARAAPYSEIVTAAVRRAGGVARIAGLLPGLLDGSGRGVFGDAAPHDATGALKFLAVFSRQNWAELLTSGALPSVLRALADAGPGDEARLRFGMECLLHCGGLDGSPALAARRGVAAAAAHALALPPRNERDATVFQVALTAVAHFTAGNVRHAAASARAAEFVAAGGAPRLVRATEGVLGPRLPRRFGGAAAPLTGAPAGVH
jgi:hypothetical protein